MITHNEEPTLKDIEEHLNRQDREVKKSTYGSYAAVGVSIILVGVSLWIGSRILSAGTLIWDFIFLIAVGFIVMCWSWYKQRNFKDSIDTHYCKGIGSDKIITITGQELPSIDIILDEARRTLDFQFEQHDGLDTKSGIILGIAGVILSLLVTASIAMPDLINSLFVKIMVSIIAVTLFISLFLSYWILRIRKWNKPPEIETLINDYASKDMYTTKCRVIGTIQEAVRKNEELLKERLNLYKRSYTMLLAGLGVVTISVITILFI